MASFTLTAGENVLIGTSAADFFIVPFPGDYTPGDSINGAGGADTIQFTSGVDDDHLVLDANVVFIEFVALMGSAALNLNASAVETKLNITGNTAANVIAGTPGDDT